MAAAAVADGARTAIRSWRRARPGGGQAVQDRADLQGLAAGGEQGAGHLQVAAQGRVGGVDPLDLVDQQQPAGGELGRPGGQGGRRVGEVAEQEPAEQQAGRAAGREGDGSHVVDGEGDPGRGCGRRPGDERGRLVEAEGAPWPQDRGQQAGGVAGAAAEVDGQAERPAGEPLQEGAGGRLEQVGEQPQPPCRGRGVAEGVAAHGGAGRPGGR
jgi:hypothetical protein